MHACPTSVAKLIRNTFSPNTHLGRQVECSITSLVHCQEEFHWACWNSSHTYKDGWG